MRLHLWKPSVGPPVVYEDGHIAFYDYPYAWNCQIDDEILLVDDNYNKRRYVVIHVDPANLEHYPKEMRKVIAKEKT